MRKSSEVKIQLETHQAKSTDMAMTSGCLTLSIEPYPVCRHGHKYQNKGAQTQDLFVR